MDNLTEQLKTLKQTSKKLATIPTEIKNQVLTNIALKIEQNKKLITDANTVDLENAKNNVTPAVYNRLKLDDNKLSSMVEGLKDLVKLEDPINKTLLARELDTDLKLYKVSCPIGVLAVIFEARPDVITQVAGLAVKSSNALVLKGGKEVLNTNNIIFELIQKAINEVEQYPNNSILQVHSHEEISNLLKMNNYIDLIIPRGGNNLVNYIQKNTTIPVLGHASGVCHIYIDETANLKMAKDIVIDSKMQYPTACNSVETLLIDEKFPYKDDLINALKDANIQIIENPESWSLEYSSNILSVKTVANIDEAILHINTYGSGHTESIVTDKTENVTKFMNEVDSAGVYHNASTRFADGYRYGFGAEVGISTNKIHARGPVGLEGLTIYKYKLYGNGQIVKDYVDGLKQFTHIDLTK
ncbi:glutamate-5-semialdehyde dehydrogenase [bacterium]|nr:glutamate-5-semialdehyde dehydrogenase [bacterium]